MNILGAHLPITSGLTSVKVKPLSTPEIDSSVSSHLVSSNVSETNATNANSVNISNSTSNDLTPSTTPSPTYEKPVFSINVNDTSENVSGKPTENGDQNPSISDEASTPVSTNTAGEQEIGETFTEEELSVINSLKLRDTEVIAHEQAHAAVGGAHAGAPSYSYETGPDGVKYAVSGEVSIDTSPVQGDPQATLQKAQQIKAAALAPTEPSAQDLKVAGKADQMAAEARSEILQKNNTSSNSGSNDNNGDGESNAASLKASLNITNSNHHQHSQGHQGDSQVDNQMQERNMHINNLYQSSSNITPVHTLDLQV